MSASSKKKLRKEQNAAQMTEKQLKEQKEAKKLKIYTGVFIAVMVLVVVFACGTVVSNLISNSGIAERNTVAMTVDGVDVSNVDLAYHYYDNINNLYTSIYNSYGENTNMIAQLMYGIDFTQPLSSQVYDEESGLTWGDYLLEQAKTSARDTLALVAAANEAGFTMSEEDMQAIEESIEYSKKYAVEEYGFSSFEEYLRAVYGKGADEESFVSYFKNSLLAQSYAASYIDSLSYEDADLRAAEAENYNGYSSYSYNYYYLSYSSFREGGTKDEEGNVTYSDEENAAARAEAERFAKELAAADIETVEDFDAAIAALEFNADKTNVKSTASKNIMYSSVSSYYRDWVTHNFRKTGDVGYFPYTTTDAEGNEVINGYYVIYFVSSNDNTTTPVGNVRHILVAFEGGITDETTGVTTYSDEEKKAALVEAEAILAEWKAGEATEDSFAALANEKSDDGDGTTGGLYEDITPASSYVTNFLNWSIDPSREVGETEIIETEYGYHIMYYVGADELSYRDYMITSDLRSADYNEWYTAITDAATVVDGDTSYIDTSIVVSSATGIY